jgi:hypothetical protein
VILEVFNHQKHEKNRQISRLGFQSLAKKKWTIKKFEGVVKRFY